MWTIPYYRLSIFRTNGFSINLQSRFIHFEDNTMFKENKKFFNKLY